MQNQYDNWNNNRNNNNDYQLQFKKRDGDAKLICSKREPDIPVIIMNISPKYAPTVRVIGSEFKNDSSLMLDTGAEVSVIKITKISGNTTVDTESKILMKGITNEIIPSLGATYAHVNNIMPITLHLVSGDFPILQDVIIGNEFFIQLNGDISYRTKSLILDS
ncbi:hypothetical protein TKK_0014579 [Trichogramma kaykai]